MREKNENCAYLKGFIQMYNYLTTIASIPIYVYITALVSVSFALEEVYFVHLILEHQGLNLGFHHLYIIHKPIL